MSYRIIMEQENNSALVLKMEDVCLEDAIHFVALMLDSNSQDFPCCTIHSADWENGIFKTTFRKGNQEVKVTLIRIP